MALTLDGRIGKDAEHLADWSEKADKKLFMEKTKESGVLIMGSKTYDTIGRPLPERKNIILTRSPQTRESSEDLIFTNNTPEKILEDLALQGFKEVILAGGRSVNTLFAREGLIDEIMVTISPLVFGHGLGLFEDDIAMKLELIESKALGEHSLVAHYRVLPDRD